MLNDLYKISDSIVMHHKMIPSTDSSQSLVINVINRKKYHLSNGLFNLLATFKEEITLQQCEEINLKKQYIHKENLKVNIDYLINNGLLINRAIPEIKIQPSEYGNLFNVKSFNEKNDSKEIVFIGIPYGNGNKDDIRCNRFPEHIRKYSNEMGINLNKIKNFELFGNNTLSNLRQHIDNEHISDWGNLYINVNEDSSVIHNDIYNNIDYLLQHNKIPLILGGDHSITYSILKAINNYYSEFVVLHFDAHLDTYKKIDDPIKANKTPNHANFMGKSLLFNSLVHVFHFGIRGICNINTPTNTTKQTVNWANKTSSVDINKILDLCNKIPVYITFDIDYFDEYLAPATATPVPNGCNMNDLFSLFEKLNNHLDIIGIDLVEINPALDKHNKTSELSSILLMNLLNLIKISHHE